MFPESPKPPKSPVPLPARRLADTAPDAQRLLAGATAPAADAAPPQALAPLKRRPLPGATFAQLPLRWAALGLAGSTAAVAGGAALLLTLGLSWSAPAGAIAAVLLALAAAAGPAVTMARRAVPAHADSAADSVFVGRGVSPKPQFLDLIEREWSRSRRYGTGAALLLIDVDRLARLADTHGTAVQDAVLAELASQTSPTLRGADAIARFGPSQLAVFLAHADATGALDVAERIRERAEALQVSTHSTPVRVTVSLGVAQLRPAHLHMQALVHDAEDAVFAARQAGGNCVRAAPVDAAARPAGSWRNDQRTKPQ